MSKRAEEKLRRRRERIQRQHERAAKERADRLAEAMAERARQRQEDLRRAAGASRSKTLFDEIREIFGGGGFHTGGFVWPGRSHDAGAWGAKSAEEILRDIREASKRWNTDPFADPFEEIRERQRHAGGWRQWDEATARKASGGTRAHPLEEEVAPGVFVLRGMVVGRCVTWLPVYRRHSEEPGVAVLAGEIRERRRSGEETPALAHLVKRLCKRLAKLEPAGGTVDQWLREKA